jgi:transcriptional regulator with XRE-family HTH domain
VFVFPAHTENHCVPSKKPDVCAFRSQFSLNLQNLRKRQGYTQEQLAEQTGMSVRYLQSLEAGEYFPSLPNLVRLKSLLGCDWNDLFSGVETVPL